jgi:hypothetical protein
MKQIDFEHLIKGNYYYIYNLDNNNKMLGKFCNSYFYNYYSIAVFEDLKNLNKKDNSITIQDFLINDFYFYYTYFFVPEKEIFLLKQVLRQKLGDIYLTNEMIKHII